MTDILEPPAQGWTLTQAAATLFPDLWHAAKKRGERAKTAQVRLQAAFSERMRRGDLIVEGTDMNASADAPRAIILPDHWFTAVAHLGFGLGHLGVDPFTLSGDVDSVHGLPGGGVLRAVRVRLPRAPTQETSPRAAASAEARHGTGSGIEQFGLGHQSSNLSQADSLPLCHYSAPFPSVSPEAPGNTRVTSGSVSAQGKAQASSVFFG